jgi:hypothetical protein
MPGYPAYGLHALGTDLDRFTFLPEAPTGRTCPASTDSRPAAVGTVAAEPSTDAGLEG